MVASGVSVVITATKTMKKHKFSCQKQDFERNAIENQTHALPNLPVSLVVVPSGEVVVISVTAKMQRISFSTIPCNKLLYQISMALTCYDFSLCSCS